MHFEEKYFSKGAKTIKRLIPDAVPTIFGNIAKRASEAEEEKEPKKIKIISSKYLFCKFW